MHTPASPAEYLDLIDQAVFEVEEMIVCADDEDDVDPWFTEIRPRLEELAAGLRRLQAEVRAGEHVFADGRDLDFMAVVRELRDRLPIVPLLQALNRVHKSGL